MKFIDTTQTYTNNHIHNLFLYIVIDYRLKNLKKNTAIYITIKIKNMMITYLSRRA